MDLYEQGAARELFRRLEHVPEPTHWLQLRVSLQESVPPSAGEDATKFWAQYAAYAAMRRPTARGSKLSASLNRDE